MIQFFIVAILDITNNEDIVFSSSTGGYTPLVILDDGWSPNFTKYVRDGEKTWSDVVEELECMTNVSTRDEALALIEKLNALVHRAARDIEEQQEYTVTFRVRSQFSNAQISAFTYIISPPDNGNVITLSTDIQTAPPGQVRFKLRFKRTGAWITTNDTITHNGSLISDVVPPSGYWKLQTTLPTNITIPTPISLFFSYNAGGTGGVKVEQLFICVNVINTYLVKDFSWDAPFNMDITFYPSWRRAYGNYGYIILDNTDSYTTDKRPYKFINLQPGTYAVFVAWRSVQPGISHRLQIQFDNNTETSNILLLTTDTKPHYTYAGTVTMTTPANILYLRTTIGHSTGFEIEKIYFVKLKETTNIINLSSWYFPRNAKLIIKNSLLYPFKNVVKQWGSNPTLKEVLLTYDSTDVIADNKSFTIVAVGNSPNIFTLITEDNYSLAYFSASVQYRTISTIFN